MNYLLEFFHQEVPKSGKSMPSYYRKSLFTSEIILAVYFLTCTAIIGVTTGIWVWFPAVVFFGTILCLLNIEKMTAQLNLTCFRPSVTLLSTEIQIRKERPLMKKLFYSAISLLIALMLLSAIAEPAVVKSISDAFEYTYAEYPLVREGIALHLDCISVEGTTPGRNILLVHGLTYSSHEFDINYEDYSLVRLLARAGYAVWRLDVAGYGRSGAVEDGFTPNSDYAGEDINAAVELIVAETGIDKLDVLGWSWGTVTSSRFAVKYPEHLNKLILYAPILNGLGDSEVEEDFHFNTWEHAAGDFQLDANGNYDLTITDPVVIELYCSSCWHYDRDYSPNGGRRDLLVDPSVKLIDLPGIQAQTLIICGDKDPYMNYDLVNEVLDDLPEGSELVVIPGASHALMIEAPFYHEFQDNVLSFLG